jgi:hypothetical protein
VIVAVDRAIWRSETESKELHEMEAELATVAGSRKSLDAAGSVV